MIVEYKSILRKINKKMYKTDKQWTMFDRLNEWLEIETYGCIRLREVSRRDRAYRC